MGLTRNLCRKTSSSNRSHLFLSCAVFHEMNCFQAGSRVSNCYENCDKLRSTSGPPSRNDLNREPTEQRSDSSKCARRRQPQSSPSDDG